MVTNGNGKTKSNKSKRTETLCQNKRLFIEKYPEYGSIGRTLRAIEIKSRQTFYSWCESDPRFKEFYKTVLLPNRRDELITVVYQAAVGKMRINREQLLAAFGFLKATNHVDDEYDDLDFREKYEHAIAGKDGKPIELIARVVDG